MVSPWDYRTVVPSFENESENFVEVVVVQRGDRAALESGTVLAAATAQINKANAPETANKRALQEDPKATSLQLRSSTGYLQTTWIKRYEPGELRQPIPTKWDWRPYINGTMPRLRRSFQTLCGGEKKN